MTITSYRRDLRAAKRELADLIKKREQIDQRIADLQPVITHLEGLCGVLDQSAAAKKKAQELTTGLTDSVREVLQRGLVPMTAAQVKQKMVERKFDFSNYSNALGSIHTVLKRLAKSGEARVVPQKAGKKAYQWVSEIQRALAAFGHIAQGTSFKVPK
jgi:hypothetical protein